MPSAWHARWLRSSGPPEQIWQLPLRLAVVQDSAMTGPWRLLRTRDPNWFAVQRAVKGAVVVPANFAIGFEVIGNAQVATFAAFGSFALLLFANLPGGIVQRFGEFIVLGTA